MADEKRKVLIKETFDKVAPIAETAAGLFYGRLWEIAPETKELFKASDMKKQGVKLMQMLGAAVGLLNDMDALVPVLQGLGKRHVKYGVTAAMYPAVGQALIWTLGQGLGEAFTEEAKEAWVWVYGIISAVMIEAATPAAPAAVPVSSTATSSETPESEVLQA